MLSPDLHPSWTPLQAGDEPQHRLFQPGLPGTGPRLHQAWVWESLVSPEM